MNASSTINAVPITLRCPTWCVETDVDTHSGPTVEMDTEGTVLVEVKHTGPTFGPFTCYGYEDLTTGTEWLFTVGAQIGPTSAESASELRELAAHANAAAAWMESVQ